MPTHETLEAKLQQASGPLVFLLTAQLLHHGDSNGSTNPHLTPNAVPHHQYHSQHMETRSPCQLFESRKLAAILTQLLNAAWDMWQEGIQQTDTNDCIALSAPQYSASCITATTTPSHQIGRRWIVAFLHQRQITAWDQWHYCNGIQFHIQWSPIKAAKWRSQLDL